MRFKKLFNSSKPFSAKAANELSKRNSNNHDGYLASINFIERYIELTSRCGSMNLVISNKMIDESHLKKIKEYLISNGYTVKDAISDNEQLILITWKLC